MNSLDMQTARELYAHGGDYEGSLGLALDEDTVLKFYPVRDKLFVVFDVVDDAYETAIVKIRPREESKYKLSVASMDVYQSLISTILTDLVGYMNYTSTELGISFSETIYVGGGAGGCLATLVATQSPPHSIVTFGMPPFCSKTVLDEIERLDDERAERMEAQFLEPSPPLKLWNIQDVYEESTRLTGGNRYDTIGEVIWSDSDGEPHYNPSRLRRLFHEFITRKHVVVNSTNYILPHIE
jgi:hypothetical protein